jgi:hypothetical protein
LTVTPGRPGPQAGVGSGPGGRNDYRLLLFDIDGRAAGCTSIGVATGRYDRDALRETGADHVIGTLEEELPIG